MLFRRSYENTYDGQRIVTAPSLPFLTTNG